MKLPRIVIVCVVAVVLIGAYVLLSPHAAAPTQPRARSFTISIVDSKLSSGSGQIEVNQNDTVTLHVTSNKADEFHLHGYDKEVELEPGVAQTITFKADKAGTFEAEVHSTDTAVAVLTVKP